MQKNDFLAMAGSYMPDLKRYLRAYGADDALAEDLAHDCLLLAAELYEHQRYDEGKSLKHWMLSTAHSRLVDYKRRQEIHRQNLLFYQDRIRSALGWELSEPHPADRQEQDHFKAHYAQTLLQTRFHNLPITVAQRRVLQMRYLDKLTYKQIAERLHLPISTILSRHTYAMRLVRGTYLSHRLRRRRGFDVADKAVC